jgi:hypothetical protein
MRGSKGTVDLLWESAERLGVLFIKKKNQISDRSAKGVIFPSLQICAPW